MELTRFDLIVIRNTLKHVIQTGEGVDLFNKEIYQSTESAIEDILSEYQSDSIFSVQPEMAIKAYFEDRRNECNTK